MNIEEELLIGAELSRDVDTCPKCKFPFDDTWCCHCEPDRCLDCGAVEGTCNCGKEY